MKTKGIENHVKIYKSVALKETSFIMHDIIFLGGLNMVGIECLKKIEPICISEKLGLYIKNADHKYLKKEVKYLLLEDYYKNLEKDYHFRRKIIDCFNDEYYAGLLEKDILKLNTNQILSLISKYIIIFDYEFSENTIITNDEIFDRCDEKELSEELRKTPLINPIDEYEIEYKFLYLYNFVERSKGIDRNDLSEIFYTGYPDWQLNNTFDRFILKTYRKRKEASPYMLYKYYKSHILEFDDKVKGLIAFGKKYDRIVNNSDDYLKLDFITETLLSADTNQYSLLNYISLIEMLIVNPALNTRSQLKDKLKYFIDDDVLKNASETKLENFSTLLYDIRSRLIHGNFNSLKKELFKYKNNYMKTYNFDYGEYKEENWIIISINLNLRRIVKNIMYKYFNEYEALNDFKYDKRSKI